VTDGAELGLGLAIQGLGPDLSESGFGFDVGFVSCSLVSITA